MFENDPLSHSDARNPASGEELSRSSPTEVAQKTNERYESLGERVLRVLEYPKILARLADLTSFSASRELVLDLRPSTSPTEIGNRQRLTTEGVRLLSLKPNISIGGARDVRPSVSRALLNGTLEAQELLDIRSTLASCRSLKASLARLEDEIPSLIDLADVIIDRFGLENAIGRSIGENGEILDTASPALGRIRSELKSAHNRLIQKLNDIVSSQTYRPILQDTIITIRDGRYVVPLRAESKGQLRGIIHDQSSSGATLFIEPMQTVELNNRWRELQLDETREILRILRELSADVALNATQINTNVLALAEFDFALAKAKFSLDLGAVEPLLSLGDEQEGDRGIKLIQARHPLIKKSEVVPTTVYLGDDFAVLVITGPNTGGKTVALKTVGLLTLMAQSGLHIPADEGSRVRVFRHIHADIGDEQSIEQSLSTFSSHLRQIVNIVREAGPGSLVLLDEVGAGTDPTEGSALARSLLSFLLESGAWVMATTHYSELKAYAHNTPGVENASVEFNVETLAPTFRLSIGIPGRSNALAIAKRLGLLPVIIDTAQALVGADNQQIETLLSGIQAERDRASAERLAAQREKRYAEEIRRVLQGRLDDIDLERERVLAQAQADALRELESLRERLRRAASEIDRMSASRGQVMLPISQELRSVERELNDRAKRPVRRPRRHSVPGAEERPLGAGDLVLIKSLGQNGEVVTEPDDRGQVEVQVGLFKMRVAESNLQRLSGRDKDRAQTERAGHSVGNFAQVMSTERSVSSQIDMRGWRAEQVIPELEQYLDDAFLSGMPFVRIVHGKGTGVLRQVVREYLNQTPHVRSFETADMKDGGEGVTIAFLSG